MPHVPYVIVARIVSLVNDDIVAITHNLDNSHAWEFSVYAFTSDIEGNPNDWEPKGNFDLYGDALDEAVHLATI